jgi:hypothetical protein
MKAYLEIELFNENTRQAIRRMNEYMRTIRPNDDAFVQIPPSGWVAEIIGFNPQYRYERCFLPRKLDYSRAYADGARGIYAEYILESGKIYDVKHRVSRKNTRRYFCTVNEEGDIVKLEEQEVIEWLKNRLASTSSQLQGNE